MASALLSDEVSREFVADWAIHHYMDDEAEYDECTQALLYNLSLIEESPREFGIPVYGKGDYAAWLAHFDSCQQAQRARIDQRDR